MKRRLLAFIAVAAFLVATACKIDKTVDSPPVNKGPSVQSTPDEFAAVRVNYEKNCKLCHGDKGDGGPVKLDDGTKLKVPSFRAGHALRHSDADFVKQITKGGDGMPAFGEKLKPAEINDLVRFIHKVFQGK